MTVHSVMSKSEILAWWYGDIKIGRDNATLSVFASMRLKPSHAYLLSVRFLPCLNFLSRMDCQSRTRSKIASNRALLEVA